MRKIHFLDAIQNLEYENIVDCLIIIVNMIDYICIPIVSGGFFIF